MLAAGCTETTLTEATYLMGHSARELRRLMLQAENLRPITARLLQEAGIAPGMSVVDLGCGVGDVAFLAAELVGPAGEVTGIDRSAVAVATARVRAQAAGHTNIDFVEADIGAVVRPASYDMAIGRYVLIHQKDPPALVRAAASYVKPGGVIAFHEVFGQGTWWSHPRVSVWNWLSSVLNGALSASVAHPDVAGRMIEVFLDAGLPVPKLFSETPVGGGPDSPLYRWAAESCRTLLPRAEEVGLVKPGEIDLDGLEDTLRDAVTSARAQIGFAHQHCAWARVGGVCISPVASRIPDVWSCGAISGTKTSPACADG
jgi:SAM-dependent methyltransferase